MLFLAMFIRLEGGLPTAENEFFQYVCGERMLCRNRSMVLS